VRIAMTDSAPAEFEFVTDWRLVHNKLTLYSASLNTRGVQSAVPQGHAASAGDSCQEGV